MARRQPHPLPEGMDGVRKMMLVADNPREQALLALCGMVGLRVREACSVTTECVDEDKHELTLRGKGDVERIVPISIEAWGWLLPAYQVAKNYGPTAVIVPIYHDYARRLITALGVKANLSRSVSSHDLRATFATDLVKKGVHPRVIQILLGHASLESTMVYMGVDAQDMRVAVN